VHGYCWARKGCYRPYSVASFDDRMQVSLVVKTEERITKLTEQQFNMAGQVTVGSLHAASIAASTTVKVAVQVGAAAAIYDENWEGLLMGAPWKTGWMSSQDNTLDPWTSKWFVL